MGWNVANPTKSHRIKDIPAVTEANFDAIQKTVKLEHSGAFEGTVDETNRALSGQHSQLNDTFVNADFISGGWGHLPGVMFEGYWNDMSGFTTSAGGIAHDLKYGVIRVYDGTNWSGIPSGSVTRAWALCGYNEISNILTAAENIPAGTPMEAIEYNMCSAESQGFATSTEFITGYVVPETGGVGCFTAKASGDYLILGCITIAASAADVSSGALTAETLATQAANVGWGTYPAAQANLNCITGTDGDTRYVWWGKERRSSKKYVDAYIPAYTTPTSIMSAQDAATNIEVRFYFRAKQNCGGGDCGCNATQYQQGSCTKYYTGGFTCGCHASCDGYESCSCDFERHISE